MVYSIPAIMWVSFVANLMWSGFLHVSIFLTQSHPDQITGHSAGPMDPRPRPMGHDVVGFVEENGFKSSKIILSGMGRGERKRFWNQLNNSKTVRNRPNVWMHSWTGYRMDLSWPQIPLNNPSNRVDWKAAFKFLPNVRKSTKMKPDKRKLWRTELPPVSCM